MDEIDKQIKQITEGDANINNKAKNFKPIN